jgi:hypothetical protein
VNVNCRLTDYLAQMKKMPSVARALADEGLSLNPRQWFTEVECCFTFGWSSSYSDIRMSPLGPRAVML